MRFTEAVTAVKKIGQSKRDALAEQLAAHDLREQAAEVERTKALAAAEQAYQAWDAPRRRKVEAEEAARQARRLASRERAAIEAELRGLPSNAMGRLAKRVDDSVSKARSMASLISWHRASRLSSSRVAASSRRKTVAADSAAPIATALLALGRHSTRRPLRGST